MKQEDAETMAIQNDEEVAPIRFAYEEFNQTVIDSFLTNNSDLEVELLFHFNQDFDSNTFDRAAWMYTYKEPKVFKKEDLSIHFESKTLIFRQDKLVFCNDCLDTNSLKRHVFKIFRARPIFEGIDPRMETWEEQTEIESSLGKVTVTTHPAFCYDTGNHFVTVESEGKELRTLTQNNLIIFEDSVSKELYVIEYACCEGLMNIFRIKNNAS